VLDHAIRIRTADELRMGPKYIARNLLSELTLWPARMNMFD